MTVRAFLLHLRKPVSINYKQGYVSQTTVSPLVDPHEEWTQQAVLTEVCRLMLNETFLLYSGVKEDHDHALRDTAPREIG